MPVRDAAAVALSQDGRELATAAWDAAAGLTTVEFWHIGATFEVAAPSLLVKWMVPA